MRNQPSLYLLHTSADERPRLASADSPPWFSKRRAVGPSEAMPRARTTRKKCGARRRSVERRDGNFFEKRASEASPLQHPGQARYIDGIELVCGSLMPEPDKSPPRYRVRIQIVYTERPFSLEIQPPARRLNPTFPTHHRPAGGPKNCLVPGGTPKPLENQGFWRSPLKNLPPALAGETLRKPRKDGASFPPAGA
jgi:hypothetical protein